MAIMTFRKISLFILLASLLMLARADETTGGIMEEIEEALDEVYLEGKNFYEKLSPPGKFAVGAGVGLVGSRVAVKTAVTGVKVAGTAFIVYVSNSLPFSTLSSEGKQNHLNSPRCIHPLSFRPTGPKP